MISNYFKIALRNLWKNKNTSFINILGLSIAIFASILIFLYVSFEFSFDSFHSKGDRIYRVLLEDNNLGVSENLVGINFMPMGPALEERLPEVVDQVRILTSGRELVSLDDKSFYTENLAYTTSSLFNIFDFQLLQGNPETALSAPLKAVINQDWKKRLFGNENPIGKTFKINNEDIYEVTGVLKNVPPNSHLQFDILLSLVPTESDSNFARMLGSWGQIGMPTYILLDKPESEAKVSAELLPTINEHRNGRGNFGQQLQSLKDVHLKSSNILFDRYNQNKTDEDYLYTLILVAAFIIIIAVFNFMNLSTARSVSRAKEVGLRKVVGGIRIQMIMQFLFESTVICFLSLLIGLGFVEFFAPMLKVPITGSFILHFVSNTTLLTGLVASILLLGLFSGIYPAFVLSRYKPITVLRGSFGSSKSGIWFRRVLVVIQFTASITMIIGTSVVFNQLDYISNKNMGFQPEQIININLDNPDLRAKAETFKSELKAITGIKSIGASTDMPGEGFGRTGGLIPEGLNDEESWIASVMDIDDNYFETVGMEMAAGRNFSKDFPSDVDHGLIINESAARDLGWDDPVSKRFNTRGERYFTVVGVVKDFHFENMQHKIEPLIIGYDPEASGVISIKVDASGVAATIASIQNVWEGLFPSYPFEYRFFDESFASLFENDRDFGTLVANFTWLAIFIACLGLFGLAAFTGEQKTKEIGIRKVMGASSTNIMYIISRDFALLVIIASLIASPLAYYTMNKWLEGFEYKSELNAILFIISSVAALIVALITISFHTYKAANLNPADSLRNE